MTGLDIGDNYSKRGYLLFLLSGDRDLPLRCWGTSSCPIWCLNSPLCVRIDSLLERETCSVTRTNSTPGRTPPTVRSLCNLVACCWAFASSSLNAHGGNPCGFHNSIGRLVTYWSAGSRPANVDSLPKRLGFFRDEDDASFSLKCTPCCLSSRNRLILSFIAAGGEPGGEPGISKFGTVGSVRFRMIVLASETDWDSSSLWPLVASSDVCGWFRFRSNIPFSDKGTVMEVRPLLFSWECPSVWVRDAKNLTTNPYCPYPRQNPQSLIYPKASTDIR